MLLLTLAVCLIGYYVVESLEDIAEAIRELKDKDEN